MSFTLDDFVDAAEQMLRLPNCVGIPGIPPGMQSEELLRKDLRRVVAIIQSMTRDERAFPDQIHPNRARRIARGSGTEANDVSDLVRQFVGMRRMIERMQSDADGSIPFQRRIWPLE